MVRQTEKSGDFTHLTKLPLRVEAAVALMQMGISDYAQIASCVGMTEEQVQQIDLSDDKRIRRLALDGVSPEKRYRLVHPLRCPKCRGRITVAPCLVCSGPA
jgi:hypothetical protein